MPPVHYTINGNAYNFGYYPADGIYPNWPTFVKAIRHPYEQKKVYFTQMQESCRKDIERAFGVLQAKQGGRCCEVQRMVGIVIV
jgi:hypothetical protein